jgi:hypothetical protein
MGVLGGFLAGKYNPPFWPHADNKNKQTNNAK